MNTVDRFENQGWAVNYPNGFTYNGTSYTGNAFSSNAFIKTVCGITNATSSDNINSTGCPWCAVSMLILYKGNLSNETGNRSNTFYAVKETVTKSSNGTTFAYARKNFTANLGRKSITITQPNNTISLNDAIIHLSGGGFVMFCLTRPKGMHFVLAEGIDNSKTNALDRILVIAPDGGIKRTLGEALERGKVAANVDNILTMRQIS